MKRVGILTINDNNNYGNRLQNYAVQEVLKKNKLDVKTIINTTMKVKKEKITIKNFLPKCFRKAIRIYEKSIKKYKKREECFSEFNKNIVFDNVKINENNVPENIGEKFDLFFTGSDQVWNPTFNRMSDIDFLTFANKEKRNSISASFGVSNISENLKTYYKPRLNELNHISVREERGKEIIEELTGRTDVEVLIDPTMMLDSEEWDKVSKRPEQLKTNKYILNYFLGDLSKKRKEEINKIAKENDCEVINILDKNSPFYLTGPAEFLYLEKNAFLICTDSFHSCVFAILYNRPFIVFEREDKFEKMNSRIETLLSKFNLENRYYKENITNELLKIDYSETCMILQEERKKVKQFITKALDV